MASIEQLKKCDWPGMEADVVRKLHLLRKYVDAAPTSDPIHDQVASDLIVANLKLLMQFCDNIQVEGDGEGRPPQ